MDEKNGNHRRHPLCGWNRRDIDRGCHRRRSCRAGFSDRSGNWGDSEEIWDDTEQLPEEIDEPDEMEEQLDIEKQCE